SADPTVPPLIDHKYNTLESDYHRFEQAWEFCQTLATTSAFAGAKSKMTGRTLRDVLEKGIASANHQVGTCRMGASGDATAVVGKDLRVHGIANLMVADASVFPDNIMHNTNFTCMVIGEIAADFIRGKRSVPAN